jgi:hypothetical protein
MDQFAAPALVLFEYLKSHFNTTNAGHLVFQSIEFDFGSPLTKKSYLDSLQRIEEIIIKFVVPSTTL